MRRFLTFFVVVAGLLTLTGCSGAMAPPPTKNTVIIEDYSPAPDPTPAVAAPTSEVTR